MGLSFYGQLKGFDKFKAIHYFSSLNGEFHQKRLKQIASF